MTVSRSANLFASNWVQRTIITRTSGRLVYYLFGLCFCVMFFTQLKKRRHGRKTETEEPRTVVYSEEKTEGTPGFLGHVLCDWSLRGIQYRDQSPLVFPLSFSCTTEMPISNHTKMLFIFLSYDFDPRFTLTVPTEHQTFDSIISDFEILSVKSTGGVQEHTSGR